MCDDNIRDEVTEDILDKQQPEETSVAEEKIPKQKKKKQNTELEDAKKQAEELRDKLLRTAAEYDNYRKRTDKEKLASSANGVASAIEKMIPVLDTLELASISDTADEEYKKGVVMTVELFRNALKSLGVEEIEALGTEFDPQLHCAVMRQQTDEAESGRIVAVMQKGYKLGDRIIRHSMVAVSE